MDLNQNITVEHHVLVSVPEKDDGLSHRASARRAFIDREGKTHFGVSSEASPKIIPTWYEPEAFQRAQRLFKIYGVVYHFAQFYGLMLALAFYEGVTPLLVTGNSQTVSKLYTRYLSTMMHVENWYNFDPFDPNSKSYRSLKIVRGLHRQVATKLNRVNKLDAEKPEILWMSQWSMCHAQFTFMGFATVFGKNLGFHCFSSRDYHALFHFWRVIGHCLGIEDRFNLCAGTDEEIFELCRQCYYEEWLPTIKSTQEKIGLAMANGIALSMFRVVPFVRFNVLLRFGAPFMGLDKHEYPLKSIIDYLIYATIWIVVKLYTRSMVMCWIMSSIVVIHQRVAVWIRRLNAYLLKRKFDYKYESDERCPFEVKINYRNAFQLNLHSNWGYYY